MDSSFSDNGSEYSNDDEEYNGNNDDVLGDIIGYDDDENISYSEDEYVNEFDQPHEYPDEYNEGNEENENEGEEYDVGDYVPIDQDALNTQPTEYVSNFTPPTINISRRTTNVTNPTLNQNIIKSPTPLNTQQNLMPQIPVLNTQRNLTIQPITTNVTQNQSFTPLITNTQRTLVSPPQKLSFTPIPINPQQNVPFQPTLANISQSGSFQPMTTNVPIPSMIGVQSRGPISPIKNVETTPAKNITSSDIYQMITIDISELNDWDVRNANGEVIENYVHIPDIKKQKRYEKIKESHDTIRRTVGTFAPIEDIEQSDIETAGAYNTTTGEQVTPGSINKSILTHGISVLNNRAMYSRPRVVRKKKQETSNLDVVMKGLSMTCEMKKPPVIVSRYNPLDKEVSESQYEYETRIKIYNALIGKNLPQDTADVISRMKKNVVTLGVNYNESMKNLLDSIKV